MAKLVVMCADTSDTGATTPAPLPGCYYSTWNDAVIGALYVINERFHETLQTDPDWFLRNRSEQYQRAVNELLGKSRPEALFNGKVYTIEVVQDA